MEVRRVRLLPNSNVGKPSCRLGYGTLHGVRFGINVGQIGTKWDKSGIFSDQTLLHFGSATNLWFLSAVFGYFWFVESIFTKNVSYKVWDLSKSIQSYLKTYLILSFQYNLRKKVNKLHTFYTLSTENKMIVWFLS